MVHAVAAAIPAARLVLLDGAGHRPDIRDPEHVNRLLSDFGLGSMQPAW
jgi:pimeloyl-ACP methyl ester carboxylesterase